MRMMYLGAAALLAASLATNTTAQTSRVFSRANPPVDGGGEICMGVNSDSSTTNNFHSKGNVVTVDIATVLTDISIYLENVAAGTNLWWAVYESTSLGGTYSKVLEVTAPTGGGNGYFSSGLIFVPLEVGMYYWIGGFWDQPVRYFFSNTMPGAPLYFSFGAGTMTYHWRDGAYTTLPGPPTFPGNGSPAAPYWQCYTVDSGAIPCPADVNGDGVVDQFDLLAVLAAWGATSGPEDVNGDGIVNVLDILDVLAAWGPCPGEA